MIKILMVTALLFLMSCALDAPPDPSLSSTHQDMRCQNCGDGGGPTYAEAMTAMGNYVAGTYSGSQRISADCDSVEISGAVGYSCWVSFTFLGSRYTAQCTVWDNTSSGGVTGVDGCHLSAN